MKRILRLTALAALVAAIVAAAIPAIAGNGGPSGSHYNLNFIGVAKDKTASMTNNDGRRIFVPLWRTSSIGLMEGSTFKVLDANATDGKGSVQLPNPDVDNDGITAYSVWARALGKPKGTSTMTTCAYDALDQLWCSTYAYVAVRDGGKSTFENVSKELLYVYADMDANGSLERYPLFHSALKDYFWNYDNNGLKVLQLRFYQNATNVN